MRREGRWGGAEKSSTSSQMLRLESRPFRDQVQITQKVLFLRTHSKGMSKISRNNVKVLTPEKSVTATNTWGWCSSVPVGKPHGPILQNEQTEAQRWSSPSKTTQLESGCGESLAWLLGNGS